MARRGSQPIQPAALVEDRRPARNLDSVLGYHLRRAQEASFRAFAARAGRAPVWPGWYSLLTIISDNPNINQTALSQASQRDKSTLTASLRALEKAGLVERRRDPNDRRSFGLLLTVEGQAHLALLVEHARAHDAQLDAIVGGENKAILLKALRDIAEQLGQG